MDTETSRKQCWKWIGTMCAVLLLLTASHARAGRVAETRVKIDRIALFKNGLGYFTSGATLPKGASTIKLGQLPVPSHGTFWVGYPKDLKVRGLFTRMEDIEESMPARSVAELLQVNVGRRVTVTIGSGDAPVIRGTIVSVMPDDTAPEPPSPYIMDTRRPQSGRWQPPYRSPSLVVIKTEDGGNVALNAGSITRADFEGEDVKTTVNVKSKRPSMRMALDESAKDQRIGLSYLARGITWSPSYLIDISDAKTAKLSAKAVVINEVADLKDVQLELVTGFPNIRFGEVNSPMAMSQSLKDFLNALSSGRSESRGRGQFMMQQQVMMNDPNYGNPIGAPMPGYSTARAGTVSEDLFLYPVDHFSLRRGETAYLGLFTAEVPCRHIYIWKIPDMLDSNERYRRERESDDERLAEKVWHACRLTNNMKMPWTTATAEFVKDGQITGQDICYYTAAGTETTIRINRAMNVLAEEAELEQNRERNAATFHGSRYDLVKVRGELKLENRLDKTANVEITKQLSGEVLETDPEATDTPTAKGLKRVNPRHVLVWEIALEPGERRTLSYTYEVYVRN